VFGVVGVSNQGMEEVGGGSAPPAGMVELEVGNMTCGKCVGRVERALQAVPGVAAVSVDLEGGTATVHCGGGGCPTLLVQTMIAALEVAGYPAKAAPKDTVDAAAMPLGVGAPGLASDDVMFRSPPIVLEVGNMTCGKCVGRVERALQAVPGVTAASVDLAAGRARVEGAADAGAMIAALEDAGYPAQVAEVWNVELAVDHMTCHKCVGRVERALKSLAGVRAVAVLLEGGRARVQSADDGDDATLVDAMVTVLAEAGYPARQLGGGDGAGALEGAAVAGGQQGGASAASAGEGTAEQHGVVVGGLPAGLPAARRVDLVVEGMTCGKCVGRVERALKVRRGGRVVTYAVVSGGRVL